MLDLKSKPTAEGGSGRSPTMLVACSSALSLATCLLMAPQSSIELRGPNSWRGATLESGGEQKTSGDTHVKDAAAALQLTRPLLRQAIYAGGDWFA